MCNYDKGCFSRRIKDKKYKNKVIEQLGILEKGEKNGNEYEKESQFTNKK